MLEQGVSQCPPAPLSTLSDLAFQLRNGQSNFFVGTTALPSTTVDKCRSSFLKAVHGDWDAPSVAICDARPTDALDKFADSVLAGLRLYKRPVLEGFQ